jgi:uncharacterized membrane protein (UPF0127 family)
MWSAPLPVAQGLLIPRCASVHTLFMRYPLDVIYLDKRGAVVKLVHALNPWRLSWGGGAASQTLEMTAGGIAHCGIQLGDCLALPFTTKEHYA